MVGTRQLSSQLLVQLAFYTLIVLGFSLSQNLYAAQSKAGSQNICGDAGKMLAAALDGEAHHNDVLLPSPPKFPSVAVADPVAISKLVRLTVTSDVWRLGWIGEPPSDDLVRRWFAAPYVSISKCFGPAKSRRKVDNLAGFVHLSPVPVGAIRPAVIRATAPVLDKSGTYALVLYSTAAPILAGRVALVLLRRDGSHWRKVGSRIIAMS